MIYFLARRGPVPRRSSHKPHTTPYERANSSSSNSSSPSAAIGAFLSRIFGENSRRVACFSGGYQVWRDFRCLRTGSWTGPPRGKWAPRVGISSTIFGRPRAARSQTKSLVSFDYIIYVFIYDKSV